MKNTSAYYAVMDYVFFLQIIGIRDAPWGIKRSRNK
jgi:hypothetical protein